MKGGMMTFATAINCMDGRVQLPAIHYLQERFFAEYIDTITEPGPNRILAEQKNQSQVASILARVDISVQKHASCQIAVIGHHACAGNPVSKEKQITHIQKAVAFIQKQYPKTEVIGIWIDEKWRIHEIKS
jgi:hypothetical protein